MVYAVLAMSKNGVIGDSNDLPWYLPADLRRFKELTMNNTVVMGRKTWQSIYDRLGKPLPNRTNIVITRDLDFKPEGVIVFHELEDALRQAEDTYVIGGAQIYQQSLPYVQQLYLTEVDAELTGDTVLSGFDRTNWREVSREEHPADQKNEYPYTFLVLERLDNAKQL